MLKLSRLQLNSVLLCCLFMLGCSSEPAKTKQVAEPAKAGGTDSPENKGPDLSASGLEKVTIDSLLSRTDLNEKARKVFVDRKNRGQKTVIAREANKIIEESLIVEPVLANLNSKYGRGQYKLPSMSSFEPETSFTYSPDIPDSVERFKGTYAFYRKGIEHFQNKGFDNLTDSQKSQVVDYMNRVFEAMQWEFKEWSALNQQGDRLLAKHGDLSKDPMFLLCHGIAAGSDDELRKCNETLFKALDLFCIQEYPTRCAIVTHRQLQEFRWSREHPRVANNRYSRQCVAMKYWLEKDFRATPNEHRDAFAEIKHFVDVAARARDWDMLRDFTQSVESNERLPDWIRSMILGRYNFKLGYSWRGEDTADTVTEEGWKKLKEYCQISTKHYEKAWEINPRFPESACALIDISNLGYSGNSEDHWFQKAIEHEKGYFPAYSMRFHSLLPKWGGSHEELFELAASHAQRSLEAKDPIATDPAIGVSLINALFQMRHSSRLSTDEFREFCLSLIHI